MELLGVDEEEIIKISAKTGEGVTGVLDAIVDRIPAPETEHEETRALIFDSHYDPYRGVISLARLFDGETEEGRQSQGDGQRGAVRACSRSAATPRNRRPSRSSAPARWGT